MLGLESEVPVDNVLGSLVQVVLAQGPVAGLTIDEVSVGIEDISGLRFGREEIAACVQGNSALGMSLTSHDMPYALISATARAETIARLDRALQSEAAVLRDWAEQQCLRETKVVGVVPEWLREDFPRFFANVALYHGVESVALAYGDQGEISRFLKEIDPEPWAEIPERVPGYREFCRHVFPEFFLNANGVRAGVVASTLDRVFELCRLNLSPNASRLAVRQLSGLTAYLDTNVLFRLFGFQGPSGHLDIRRALGAGSQVGAVFRVSPRTVEEFRTAATKKIRERALSFVPMEALVNIDPNLRDRDFLEEYYKVARGRAVGTRDLLAGLAKVERTLELFGIRVWNEKTDEVSRANAEVESVSSELRQVYEDIELQKDPQQRRTITREMAQHDAHNLILIEKLRPQAARSFCDAKVWFLTFHHAFSRFSQRRSKKNSKAAAVIMFEHWTQLVRSVLPRSDDFDRTFVQNLRSPALHGHGANYHTAMNLIAGRLATYRSLPDDHFAAIVVDSSFASKVASKMSEETGVSDETLAKLVDERVAEEAASEREHRLRAEQRLVESMAQRAAASREATAATEELWSVKQEAAMARSNLAETRRQLSDATKESERLRLESAAASEDAKRRRERIQTALRGGVSLLLLGLLIAAWTRIQDDWTVAPTQVNVFSISVVLLGTIGALLFWGNKTIRTAIAIGAPILLAALAVGPWRQEPKLPESPVVKSKVPDGSTVSR